MNINNFFVNDLRNIRIEKIWPEAFELSKLVHYTAWDDEGGTFLACLDSKDERYYLSRGELAYLEPSLKIHSEYKDFSVLDSAIGE